MMSKGALQPATYGRLKTSHPFRVVRVLNSTLANGFRASTGILLYLTESARGGSGERARDKLSRLRVYRPFRLLPPSFRPSWDPVGALAGFEVGSPGPDPVGALAGFGPG